jgi:hypothetical protein
MGVDSSSTLLIRGFTAFNALGEPLLSGKIMYLSQYATVNVSVSVDAAHHGSTLVDAPGMIFGKRIESEGKVPLKVEPLKDYR